MEKSNVNEEEKIPVENMPAGQEKKTIAEIGEGRAKKMGESLTKAKGWLSSKFKAGFSNMGGAMKKTFFATLGAPEAIGRASVATGKGVAEGAKFMGSGVKEFGKGMEEGAEAFVGVEQYLEDQAKKGMDWVGNKAVQGSTATKEFIATKNQQLDQWGTEKAQLIEKVASFTKNKVVEGAKFMGSGVKEFGKGMEEGAEGFVEGMTLAKEELAKGWFKMIKFGKDSIDAAKFKAREAYDKYQERQNKLRLQRMEEEKQQRIAELKAEHADYEQMMAEAKIEQEKIAKMLEELTQVGGFEKNMQVA